MTPEDLAARLDELRAGGGSNEAQAQFRRISHEWEDGDITALDRLIQLLALPDE